LNQDISVSSRSAPGFSCFCFRARLAARRVTAFYEDALAPHGLNINQFSILATVSEMRDAPMNELAAALALDPSTLSRTMRPLENEGLIQTAPDGANRRLRRARLTRSGMDRLKRALPAWLSAQRRLHTTHAPDAIENLMVAIEEIAPTSV